MVEARHAAARTPRWTALFLLLILATGLAACGSGAAATRSPGSNRITSAPALSGADSSAPAASVGIVDPSVDPAATSDPAVASPDGASGDPGVSASASATPGAADGCTGTDKNRAFFATVAAGVDWDVYCPVLPAGWSVTSGSYRLTSGGKLDISYRGPGGRTLEIREGAFCTDPSNGCIVDAPDRGAVPFADRQAELYTAPNATSTAVVDRGAHVSWVVDTSDVDEATLKVFLAHLIKVE